MPEELKACVCGSGQVGKTCLIIRWIEGKFDPQAPPTDLDVYAPKAITVGDEEFELTLHDLGGQPEMKQIRQTAYPSANVIIFCFALNEQSTLDDVRDLWLEEVNESFDEDIDLPKILVGCKSDISCMEGDDELDKIEEMVAELGFHEFVDCSSKDSDNIDKVFRTAI